MMPKTRREVLDLDVVRRGQPQVVAAADRLDAPVRWVHAIELTDVGRLLRGGELVLTTGVRMPTDAAGLRREPGQRKTQNLAPEGLRPLRQAALLKERAGGRTAELAARGLRHGAGRHENDLLRRRLQERCGAGRDGGAQGSKGRGVAIAGFGEDDDALGAALPIRAAENRDAALAHARDIADRGFDLFGVDMAAGGREDGLWAGRGEGAADRRGAVIWRAGSTAASGRSRGAAASPRGSAATRPGPSPSRMSSSGSGVRPRWSSTNVWAGSAER